MVRQRSVLCSVGGEGVVRQRSVLCSVVLVVRVWSDRGVYCVV